MWSNKNDGEENYYIKLVELKFITKQKIEVLSLSTVFISSKLNMCKYLYEHKIQQLRHKLNKFHRHVTNRN